MMGSFYSKKNYAPAAKPVSRPVPSELLSIMRIRIRWRHATFALTEWIEAYYQVVCTIARHMRSISETAITSHRVHLAFE